jgi:hypothetical protein
LPSALQASLGPLGLLFAAVYAGFGRAIAVPMSAMSALQGVLGAASVIVGVALIAGRRRIGQRARRRRASNVAVPIVWMFLGALLVMNGVLQLVLAAA